MSPTTSLAPPWDRGRAAAWATTAVGGLSRRLGVGSGSVVGGRVGLLVAPDLLERLGRHRTVALVTGTNGKTTTTRLLTAALGGASVVATNAAGSNLPAGLVAALAGARCEARAVLEVDEGYLGSAVAALGPVVVALLNLSRDQLDRVSEVRMVAARFRQALAGFEGTVVANADDPLVAWAAGTAPNVRWVGAGQLWRSDAVGCPACDGPVTFAAEGPGWSSTCGLARPTPVVWLQGDELVFDDGRRLAVSLSLPGRCNRANAAMAVAAASVLGVEPAAALEAMAPVGDVEGRFATVSAGDVTVRLLLAKNPAGWTELLEVLEDDDDPVVVAVNARVADGHDPSWLWDVAFERLAGRRVVATGERARDLAVRLRHAGVSHVTVPDQLAALGAAGAAHVQYVGNYTAFQDLRRELGRGGRGAHGDGAVFAVPAPVVQGRRARRHGDRTSALRVVVVHPDLLGTYGDGGNAVVLASRALWRHVDVELVLAPSDVVLPAAGDLYCLGGGEDGPELQAAAHLASGQLAAAVASGAAVLAVCAGYQVAGKTFPDATGAPRPGLGLLDVHTVKGTGRRAVGELLAASEPGLPIGALTGFENHGGLTRLGPGARPLGRVRAGVGNGDGTEGARCGSVVGTYLHGPVLARNPALADFLLGLAIGTDLAPLDDEEEQALRAERLAQAPGRRLHRVRRL
ncbi:MAG TPA: MurT ligase domain-containing protein [Acidimicrobiales bacterium]|nr:MurT ligase domain-containing protein [Acidimicrobiales bacterium]